MTNTALSFLDDSIQILERTPRVLSVLLSQLSVRWAREPMDGERWNAYDVVGHLIHGEKTDWVPRMKIVLEHGEAHEFPAFDREAQFQDRDDETMAERLEEFSRLRASNVEILRSYALDDEALELTGIHPELGKVTLRNLLATWVAHDLGHLAQITRAMASRLAIDVGPWADPRYMRHLAEAKARGEDSG